MIVIVFVVRHGVSANRFVNSTIGNYWMLQNSLNPSSLCYGNFRTISSCHELRVFFASFTSRDSDSDVTDSQYKRSSVLNPDML